MPPGRRQSAGRDIRMYQLHIANKNYSSWSLRPWVLMSELGLPFEEHLMQFGDGAAWNALPPAVTERQGTLPVRRRHAVSGTPSRSSNTWPSGRQECGRQDPRARAWARSAAAEMHSGFAELRQRCSMSCGVRVRLHERRRSAGSSDHRTPHGAVASRACSASAGRSWPASASAPWMRSLRSGGLPRPDLRARARPRG